MIKLPKIYLNEDYVDLLKINIHDISDSSGLVYQLLGQKKNLFLLVRNTLLHGISERKVEERLRPLGWMGLRDQIGEVFLQYYRTRKFPKGNIPNSSQDILSQERKLESYTVSGSSRAYLFLFYLESAKIYYEKNDIDKTNTILEFPSITLEYLKFLKFKSPYLDWTIIMILHFHYFLGQSILEELLNNRQENYQSIYAKLTFQQKQQMMINYLAYSYSINEQQMYFERTI